MDSIRGPHIPLASASSVVAPHISTLHMHRYGELSREKSKCLFLTTYLDHPNDNHTTDNKLSFRAGKRSMGYYDDKDDEHNKSTYEGMGFYSYLCFP